MPTRGTVLQTVSDELDVELPVASHRRGGDQPDQEPQTSNRECERCSQTPVGQQRAMRKSDEAGTVVAHSGRAVNAIKQTWAERTTHTMAMIGNLRPATDG